MPIQKFTCFSLNILIFDQIAKTCTPVYYYKPISTHFFESGEPSYVPHDLAAAIAHNHQLSQYIAKDGRLESNRIERIQ